MEKAQLWKNTFEDGSLPFKNINFETEKYKKDLKDNSAKEAKTF